MHVLLQSTPPTLQQATADPHLSWRLLDTHGQVWVSLLWGHCSFLLGPGAHNALFVPSKSLFPVLCKFWQLYDGVNGDLLQKGLCHTQVYCTQRPCPCSSPLLTCISAEDTQTQFCLSLWVLVHTRFFETSEFKNAVPLAGTAFESKCAFAPLTIFLGPLLCIWMCDISSKSLQHLAATAPVPTIFLELLCPWMLGNFSKSLQRCTVKI